MTRIETIKNKLIDRVLATNNEELLKAINSIFESTSEEEKVMLSPEQIEMLQMSENDILNGEIISESQIENMDEEWSS